MKRCYPCENGDDYDKCNEVRKGYEEAGMDYMLGYCTWPSGKTDQVEHRRSLFCKHLNCNSKNKNIDKKYVSYTHFHPTVIKKFRSGRLPFYLSKELGDSVGIDRSDRYEQGDDSKFYHNVPNVSRNEALSFIAIAKAENIPVGGGHSILKRKNMADEQSRKKERENQEKEEKKEHREKEKDERKKLNLFTNEQQMKYVTSLQKKAKQDKEDYDDTITALKNQINYLTALVKAGEEKQEKIKSGLTRENIIDENWHETHKQQCKDLFGFYSFKEMKIYMECFWPEYFDENKLPHCFKLKENGNISEFEQALITKMRFHRKVTVEHLAGIYGVHYTSISRYITKWAPRWGDIGLDLSILHLTPEYLKKSCPKEFRDSGMQNVAALVDGKVFKTEDCRKNSAIKRAMYSDKVHHPGVLQHTWTTPSGLTFDHSYLVTARCTETALVEVRAQQSGFLDFSFEEEEEEL